jgi:hypothetical protein
LAASEETVKQLQETIKELEVIVKGRQSQSRSMSLSRSMSHGSPSFHSQHSQSRSPSEGRGNSQGSQPRPGPQPSSVSPSARRTTPSSKKKHFGVGSVVKDYQEVQDKKIEIWQDKQSKLEARIKCSMNQF